MHSAPNTAPSTTPGAPQAAPAPDLHLIQLRLDQRALFRLARHRGLVSHRGEIDFGYLIHSCLGELFRDDAPSPFRWLPSGRGHLRVLAYGAQNAGALAEAADLYAEPLSHACLERGSLAAKRMPDTWSAGRRLGFEARLCPTIRRNSAADGRHRKGAEIDAHLAARLDAESADTELADSESTNEAPPREAVYRSWLDKRLRAGGAALESARLESFRELSLMRKTQGNRRSRRRLDRRPEAVLRGTLRVEDPDLFPGLLARGVGRHRSFGFGMLLLAPPGPRLEGPAC